MGQGASKATGEKRERREEPTRYGGQDKEKVSIAQPLPCNILVPRPLPCTSMDAGANRVPKCVTKDVDQGFPGWDYSQKASRAEARMVEASLASYICGLAMALTRPCRD